MSWIDDIWPHLIHQESGGNPNAVSPKGAFGLAQLMPGTAGDPGFGIAPYNASIPGDNERMGKDYLTAMYKRYGGDPVRALVAYNWGPGNADKWDGNVNSLPSETRQYVAKITGNAGKGGTQVSGSMGGGTGHTNSATTTAPGGIKVTGEFGSKAGVGPSATGSTQVPQQSKLSRFAQLLGKGMENAQIKGSPPGLGQSPQPEIISFDGTRDWSGMAKYLRGA